MISDVLSEAIDEMDRYLDQSGLYTGKLREEIISLRNQMYAMRVKLDTPPIDTERKGNGR